jgi:hypothetical protein
MLGAGATLLSLVAVWALASQGRELKRLDAAIAAESEIVDSLRAESKRLRMRVREVGEEVKALPESARLGRATRAAQEISKQQEMVEGRLTRSRARIRNFEVDKARAAGKVTRWTAAALLGWVWVVLIRMGLGRRRARGRPEAAATHKS